MPTNYLTRFATSGSANLPVESTWQSQTERSTGFKTGLARSDFFNRLFAQGANSAYVIGQFVVDYASQDATIDGSALYTNFKTAVNSYVGGSFLPKSGGTMTGAITASGLSTIVKQNSDDTYLQVCGGTDYNKGAYLRLNGKDLLNYTGSFVLTAHDGTTGKSLVGKADGTLTWGGQDVVTAQGGVATNGNFLYRSVANGYLRISGGSSATLGGNVVFRGESATTNPGGVEIWAHTKQLTLTSGGGLKWDGRDRFYDVGTYSNVHWKGVGYLTSSATALDLILPIAFSSGVSSVTMTSVTGTLRVGAGGYLNPGDSSSSDVLSGTTVSWFNFNTSNCPTLRLTRSAGWGSVGVNNCVVAYDLTFGFKCE